MRNRKRLNETSDVTHGQPWVYAEGCRCKPCTDAAVKYNTRWKHKNPDKYKAQQKRLYRRRKARPIETRRNEWLRWRYGITHDQYDAMIAEQGGCCAMCGDLLQGGKHTTVDHNHATGKVRAILCMHCNRGLGMFRESIERLERAIAYLKAHEA